MGRCDSLCGGAYREILVKQEEAAEVHADGDVPSIDNTISIDIAVI